VGLDAFVRVGLSWAVPFGTTTDAAGARHAPLRFAQGRGADECVRPYTI
jgi:hypothetical protein